MTNGTIIGMMVKSIIPMIHLMLAVNLKELNQMINSDDGVFNDDRGNKLDMVLNNV